MKLQRACGLSVCSPATAAINTTFNHQTPAIQDEAKGVNEVQTSAATDTFSVHPAQIRRRGVYKL